MPDETNDLSIIKRIEEKENIRITKFHNKKELDDEKKRRFKFNYCLITGEINVTELVLNRCILADYSLIKELKNLSTLYLSHNRITDVTFLKELKNLSSLDLRNNNLADVISLKELKNLSSLDLRNNNLTDVTFLKELKNLSTLYLSNNKLTDVTFLKELKNLSSLYVGYNRQTDFTFLKEMKNLSSLDLRDNRSTDFTFLKELKNLSSLYLRYNRLTDVSFLKELKNLSSLDLRNNRITNVTFLKELKNLSLLYLSYNRITDVTFLKELKNLSSLDLTHNPITIPPKNIWNRGINSIHNYFKQIDEQGTDYLYEAKIILVGEPGAGKTSLLKKIRDPFYFVPNIEEKETIGIQVEVDTYPHPNKPEISFRANIWDFGGQDIQYTIHQFFLTADALYLLVLDDRKENTDYDYWFNIIRVLGEHSPVIVVLNEVNKLGLPNFDFVQYKNRYPDLNLEKREVDLSVNDGRLTELLEKIKLSVTQLKGIGTPLPKQWIPIRKELENLVQRNHIPYDEFVEICKRNNLIDAADQEFLAQTFHRIGVFLHFGNDPNLYGTVYTNHKWVVDALYTVLKETSLRETNGLFEKKRIFELWGNNYTTQEKNQLLSLMLKNNFDICYKVSGTKEEKYLFPVLLPTGRPDFVNKWDFTNNLRFRFQYKFMPKGIITRLIVRLSDYIYDHENKNIVWRTGAVLKKGDSLAVISEDIDGQGLKVIDLAVNGKEYDKKDFLIIIKDELKRIHSSTFNNLQVNEMVPCVCKECICNKEPNFFDYNDLEKYRTNNVSTIRCNKSTSLEEVDVNKLIEGYETISEINSEEHEDDFLPHIQQPLPVMPVEKEPGYKKWAAIFSIVGVIGAVMYYSFQIVNSCSTKETGQPNAVPQKNVEQVKRDSIRNVVKDSSANKQKINNKK